MAASDTFTKIVLDESEIPTHWYNVVPDLPHPQAPVLHPATGQTIGPADLAPLFPMALIDQQASKEQKNEIPDEPPHPDCPRPPTPLIRASLRARLPDT